MKRRELIRDGLAASAFAGLTSPRLVTATSNPPTSTPASVLPIRLRSKEGEIELSRSLTDPNYWNGIEVERPTGELWDEFKIKPLNKGFLTYISGEGREDFDAEHVFQTAFKNQHHLPKHMSGAKAMRYFERGVDRRFNVPFTDMLFLGDMDFFYCQFYQRNYRYELDDGRLICAFERMEAPYVGPKLWKEYEEMLSLTVDSVDLRWGMFNSVIPVTEAYGMYIIEPGQNHRSRVTLTAKLRFGTGTGLLAQVGSELPFLVRTGTINGFNGSVAVCSRLKSGEYRMR